MNQKRTNSQCCGHGIVDVDTEDLISIANGEIVTTAISSIVKGEKDNPGEIKGSIKNSKTIGKLYSNTEFGMYGNLTNRANLDMPQNNELEVASREEIRTETAKVILNIENNIRKEYDVEIIKIYKNNNMNNKSMLIKITDEKLLRINRWDNTRNVWCTNYTKWEIYTEL